MNDTDDNEDDDVDKNDEDNVNENNKMEMMMLMIRSFCSLSREIVLHRLSPPAGCIPNAQTFETNWSLQYIYIFQIYS